MDKKDILLIADAALSWCIDKWGNKCKFENITIEVKKMKMLGKYDFEYGHIIISENHKNLIDIVDTVIHEFIHSTQDPYKYYKAQKKYKYDENPFEIEAYNKADKWKTKCLKDIINYKKRIK